MYIFFYTHKFPDLLSTIIKSVIDSQMLDNTRMR